MREARVVLLAGDGIGPEVVGEARRILDAVIPAHGLRIVWQEETVGGVHSKQPTV